jgi:YD repeat-containing protein
MTQWKGGTTRCGLTTPPCKGRSGRLLETDLTSSRDEVRNVVGLARDAALTAAFEALAGNNALQSATRLMLEANDDAPPLDVNTIAQGSTLPAERVPSGLPADVSTHLADRLFSSHLVLTDESLHEDPRVGDCDAPAGWAWWEIRGGHSAGTVLAPESALARSASVPVDLCPLDPIHDGPKTRYDALLAKASAWSDQAVQVTAWVESAIPSAASLIHTWLDTADGVREADQAPDPAAVPAAAIALHGAIDAFSKPQITAFFLDPPVLNAAGADPNYVSTLNASVATSSKVVELDFAFEDERGHSDGANQTETDLDGMQFDVALDLSQMTLAEGPHAVAVRAQTQGGGYPNSRTPSAPASASYIVDNTTPAVSLVGEGTTIDVSGFYSVRGSVADPNLASYVVECESAPDSWTALHRATTEIPVTSQLARINTSAHGWTWGEDVDVRVRATDAAGNSASKQLTLHVLNDDDAPAIALSAKIGADGVREAANVEAGDDVFDTLDATLSVTETPAVSEDGQGLSRVRLWIESQSDPSRRFDLIDQTFSAPADSYGPSTVNFDTFELSKIAGSYERWRVAAEAIDVVGNRSTAEIADLKPANQLLRFDAGPRVFATGWSDSVRDCRHTVIVADFDPGQAAPAWTLHIKNAGGATQRAYASSDPGLAPGSFRISWYGNAQGAAGDDSYVTPGAYALELRYGAAPNEKQAVLPIIVAPDQADYAPRVTQLRALDAAQQQGKLLAIPQGEDELSGQELIVSGDYPILEITGAIDQALNAFLDGQGPNPPDFATVPYSEAFWTVDLKSSTMPPTQEDAQDAANNPAAHYENLTDRSSWRNVAWGYDWGNTTPTPDGQVVSVFDTAQLSPGYYDVRLWVTDGRGFAHNIVFFIKVVRNADSPDTGVPDAVGKMALSATDMTVPFSGYTAEISRAYDSTDVYAPGPLGYGWSLGGIALEVEPYNQGAGEYDEAFVRLPDGRQFFFSNNPSASSPTNNQWATKAAYTKRPFGMSLHRPGASANFHGPDAQTLNCYTAPPNLAPGAPSRAMPLRYTTPDASRTYGPGEVAYLQTEDKTWHIFEWRAGKMLEIIRPDGQTVVFDRDADSSQVVVSDAAGREVKVEVETLKDGRERVAAIVDPAGNRVAYEYDDYGNLLTVTDRSGRKRFYIYDTPEAKQLFPDNPDLTGLNPHFLVDVRVDDDSDGVPQFSHTIEVRSPIDGRKRTVVYEDTIPEPATSDSTVPLSAFPAPHSQDFPGDVSVLQIKYENGLMTGIETVAGGVQIERQYNFGGAGGAEIVRDAATGAQTTVEYDAEHRVTQQTDPYGNATAYAYYAAGNLPGALQKETDPLGVETNYEYPNYQPQYKSFAHMFQSYLDSRIDADSTVLGYPTSAQGGPSKITQDAAGFALATDIAYETDSTKPSAFQPRKTTDPLSNETTLQYDATTGKTTNVSLKGQGTTDGAVVANEYYASGQTDLVYAALPPLTADSPSIGRLKKTVSKATPDTPLADQSITLYGYKYATGAAFETHGIKTLTDNSTQEGLVTESTYDAAGRLTSSTDAYGHNSITVYDGEGRVTRSTSADGYATYYYYDVFGRAYKERLNKPVKAAGGSLGVNQTVVNVLTYYDYDEAGRVVRTVRRNALPDGSDGDLISETRAAYESDETGRAETQIDALGLKSVSIYDAGGRLARSESYDAGGRLLDWTAYEYDALGRPYKTSTRRGVATTNEYDNLGGLTKTTVSAPGYNDQVTEYAYDDAGRQTEVARFPGTSHKRTTYYTYDALGRVTKTETRNASGETIALEETDYDSKGRRHKVWTYADASDKTATWYEYDTQDRMTHTHLGYESGARTGLDFQFAYDDYGNVASFQNPLGRARTKLYDDRGRLWREFSPKCSDDPNSPVYNNHMAKVYTYDQAGRVAQALEGVASEATAQAAIANARYVSYMYDPWTDRLTKATFRDGREKRVYYRADNGLPERTEVWKNGVRVYSRQYDYDETTWRVCAVTTPEGKVQYEYNAYGQVSRLATSAGQDVLYTYDATGRLQYVKGRDLSSDGSAAKVVE